MRILPLACILLCSLLNTSPVQSQATGNITARAEDDPEFKKFMEAFPKLTLPYRLAPGKLVGSKNVSKLPWMSKIFSTSSDNLYAVGLIKDCGIGKTLLLAQVSDRGYSRSYIFYVLELRNGYYSKRTVFTNGVFSEENGSFCTGCSLSIEAAGTTTISTNQGGKKMTESAGACF